MQPIPSITVSFGVERFNPVNSYIMNSGQISGDQLDKLWPRSSITIDECTDTLSILSPSIAHNECFRHILQHCTQDMKDTRYAAISTLVQELLRGIGEQATHTVQIGRSVKLLPLWIPSSVSHHRVLNLVSTFTRSILKLTNSTPLGIIVIDVGSVKIHEAETWQQDSRDDGGVFLGSLSTFDRDPCEFLWEVAVTGPRNSVSSCTLCERDLNMA